MSIRGPKRPLRRIGIAALAATVLVSVAGCGTRVSDEAIDRAVHSSSAVPTTSEQGAAAPAAATPIGTTAPVAAAAPVATTARGEVVPAANAATRSQPVGPAAAAPKGTEKTSTKEAPAPGSPSAGTAAGTGAAAPTVANKSTVKIGQLGTFSGVLGAVSGVGPKVMGAWVAYTNAHGGLNGHPVDVIVADDQGDPSTAVTLARRLVENYKVLMMAGNFQAFGFPQLETYMRSKNVPFIGDGVDPGWYTSPVAYSVVPPASDQIVKGLQYFVNTGARKLGMLYCVEISQLCGYLHDEVIKSAVGKYVVQAYQVSLVAPSYTSQCLRLKQAGVEVLYLLMETAGAARAAKDCAAQGYTPKIELLSVAATAEMPQIAALNGTLIPAGIVPPTATGIPGLDKYREVLKTYAPTVGDSGFSLYTFACAEMVGLVGRNLPDNPTPTDFLAGLWKVKNETLGGLTVPLTYTKGAGAHAQPCAFIWGTQNGKWAAPLGIKPIC
jgi:branched-chain amino acid transport system substrate-binding protein